MNKRLAFPLTLFFSVIVGCSITPRQETLTLGSLPVIAPTATENTTVTIQSVTDERIFKAKSGVPADHSLSTVETLDGVNTSKAVGQLRTAAGTVLFDLFADKEVRDLVKAAVEESFRRAGYLIGIEGDKNAIPVVVRVLRFWSYNTGSWTFTFTFDIDVALAGELPNLRSGKNVSSTLVLHSAVVASKRSFENTIYKGLEKFVADMQTSLH